MTFYAYLWLREDGTAYYVGKGQGSRGFNSNSHRVSCPSDLKRILIQEFPSESDALAAEVFLINHYGRIDLGTGCLRNLTAGGDIPPSRLGKKQTAEAIQKSVQSRKDNGYRHTEETKRKMSAANKGRHFGKLTPERCAAISRSLVGNRRTFGRVMPEHEKQAKRAYRHTEEAKRKIGEAARGRVQSEEAKCKVREAKIKYWDRYRLSTIFRSDGAAERWT